MIVGGTGTAIEGAAGGAAMVAPTGGVGGVIGAAIATEKVIIAVDGPIITANSAMNMSDRYNRGGENKSDNKFNGGNSTQNKSGKEAFRNAKDQNWSPKKSATRKYINGEKRKYRKTIETI